MYHHGQGVEEDIDKAIECYEKGAEMGELDAAAAAEKIRRG